LVEGNLNSFASTITAANQVKAQYPKLDGLILNAGVWNGYFKETADGIEETLQVNLLAPLLQSHLLFKNLEGATSPRIIITSSGLHQGVINFEDIEFRKKFSGFKVYRQSKLGVILVCRLLAKQLADSPVEIYNQHPGFVATSLGRDTGWLARTIFKTFGKSPKKGAETLISLLEKSNEELVNGEFYANGKVTKITKESYDLEMAAQLMDVCRNYLDPHLTGSSPIFP
jgi:NAD(P)-dependent dehydrogenase (short-subunit alcohol dehydrogenase family)